MAPTLIKPPPPAPHLSLMESTLQLTPIPSFGPGIFTNTRALWHPPGARGIYGGAAIAQSLLAAYKTLPSPEYVIHSMHCYFVLAGDSDMALIYHVERVRDGRGFVTRTVQARQGGKVIFTTTMSFMRRGAGGSKLIEHAVSLPKGVLETCPIDIPQSLLSEAEKREVESSGDPASERSPFEGWRYPVIDVNPKDENNQLAPRLPQSEQRSHNWIRVRDRISDNFVPDFGSRPDRAEDGSSLDKHVPHVCALAYMSDSYFIGTVPRVHDLAGVNQTIIDRNIRDIKAAIKTLETNIKNSYPDEASVANRDITKAKLENFYQILAILEAKSESRRQSSSSSSSSSSPPLEIGMMVSLDHTIFFHNAEHFRADEWIFSEMKSPWAGDGRGLVEQHMWNKQGVLIATCVQEGVVRLREKKSGTKTKMTVDGKGRESKL